MERAGEAGIPSEGRISDDDRVAGPSRGRPGEKVPALDSVDPGLEIESHPRLRQPEEKGTRAGRGFDPEVVWRDDTLRRIIRRKTSRRDQRMKMGDAGLDGLGARVELVEPPRCGGACRDG